MFTCETLSTACVCMNASQCVSEEWNVFLTFQNCQVSWLRLKNFVGTSEAWVVCDVRPGVVMLVCCVVTAVVRACVCVRARA